MARPRNPVPTYRHHKASGRAFVKVPDADGKFHMLYLGKWGSNESKTAYQRFLTDYQKTNAPPPEPPKRVVKLPKAGAMTVVELVQLFLPQLTGYSKSEKKHYQTAIKVLLEVHPHADPAEFGPKMLTEVRDKMLAAGWRRETINSQVRRVRKVFRWGESIEIVPAGKWHQLKTLEGLKSGKTTALDHQKIEPVSDELVEATLPHLGPTVRAMVQFQRLTGCRPQDVCYLNDAMIDRTNPEVWVFRPDKHKTAHLGLSKEVYIGPQSQAVIAPFLGRWDDPSHALFSPRNAWVERIAKRRETKPVQDPYWKPKGAHSGVRVQYDTQSYGRAISRACERAGIERWNVNQLRHAFGVATRDTDGLEATQKLMGHKSSKTTERYATVKDQQAIDVAKRKC